MSIWLPSRRLMMPVVMMAGRGSRLYTSGGGSSGGATAPQTPTLYVNAATGDDSRTKATAANSATPWATIGRAAWGSTNRASPNSAQAAAAGDVVQVEAGNYPCAGLGHDTITYQPTNNGTSGNPITFQANGTVTVPVTSNYGSAIGNIGGSWITWRGFTVSDRTVRTFASDGMVNIQSSQGTVIEQCTIIGDKYTTRADGQPLNGDQYCGVMWSDADDIIIRDNTIYGFGVSDDLSDIGSADTNHTACTGFFESNRVSIHNNDIYRCGNGFYLKQIWNGSSTPNNETGPVSVYMNHVSNCNEGMRQYVCNFRSATRLLIYQNIWRQTHYMGIAHWQIGGANAVPGGIWETKNVSIINNLIYNGGVGAGDGRMVGFSAFNQDTDCEFLNNIVVAPLGAPHVLNGPNALNTGTNAMDRNIYNGGTNFAYLDPTGNVNYSTYLSTLGRDANSTNGTTPTFVNAAGFDFRLAQNGQDALTRGRVARSIGGTNGATIPCGPYITGSETIGRRSV